MLQIYGKDKIVTKEHSKSVQTHVREMERMHKRTNRTPYSSITVAWLQTFESTQSTELTDLSGIMA